MNGSGSCFYWSEVSNLWPNCNNWWPLCVGSGSFPSVPIQSIQPLGVDASTLIPQWIEEPWNPYRAGEDQKKQRKRFIKVWIRRNDETYEEEKMSGIKDKILVENVKLEIKNPKIDLDIIKL